MFQFPGFPPIRYGLAYGCTGCSCTGCPIQKSADHWLCAPPRGLSQLVTSFIGSWCQGIRPVPFLLDPLTGTSVYRQGSFDSLLKIDVFLSSVFLEPRGSSENRLWNSENYFQIYTRMQFSRCVRLARQPCKLTNVICLNGLHLLASRANHRLSSPVRCPSCRDTASSPYKNMHALPRAFPHATKTALKSGGRLLSHTVSSAVSSAARVLTVVFGMGTGVSPGRIAARNLWIILDNPTVKHIPPLLYPLERR